jgi:N-acyl-D-aspartate/D-glutamate deacylase
VLGYWRREKNLFGLEEAVHKLTGFPAQKLRLNRGLLKEGMPADITVFDADKIDDLVTKKLPDIIDAQEVKRHPPGMKAVAVNGKVVVEDGQCQDRLPAKYAGNSFAKPTDTDIKQSLRSHHSVFS